MQYLTELVKNKIEKRFSCYQSVFLPMLGLIPLVYVFYAGFIDLPPLLNSLNIFFALFIGLSLVLYWRHQFFVVPLAIGYIGMFFLPLTWLWRGLEFDNNILMGIFPFNDGMFYLMDAYRLLMGLDRMMAPNMRPMFSGVLTLFMRIFDGNIQISLALFAVLTALSVFFLALEVRDFAGPVAAGLTTTILFYFQLEFLGRVHTENLGLILGALGLALILRAARMENVPALLFGGLSLSLALNARAGAMTIFPLLILWAWFNRKIFSWKTSVFLTFSIALGFVINAILVDSFSPKDVVPFANYWLSLYGLAAGYKGYAYILSVYPDISYTTNVAPYVVDHILKNPVMLLYGILLSFKDYFTPNIMFELMRFRSQQNAISYFLYFASLIGVVRLLKIRHSLQGSLVIYLLVGVLLSVAVIPTNDGLQRALIATNGVNALVAGLAFMPRKYPPKNFFYNVHPSILEIYAVVLGVICFASPFIVRQFPLQLPSVPVLSCPQGATQISVIVSPGSYINIVNKGPQFGFLPEVKREDIRTRLDDYHYNDNFPYILSEFPTFEHLIKNLRNGDTILIGPNLIERNIGNGPEQYIFLVTRTNTIEQIGAVNNFCARLSTADRLKSNRFYYDLSIDMEE